MELKTNCEIRGISQRVDDKNMNHYYVNLEDEKGESCKFPVDQKSNIDLKSFKKGDKVNVVLDLSVF